MRLYIKDFPSLESFPHEGLPSNLEEMTLNNCFKLKSFPGNMHMMSSFRSLHIEDCIRIESFDGGLPSNLEEMTLINCSKLESLPRNMHMLSSLRRLDIKDCSSLELFPNEVLPANMENLEIINYSRLIGSLKGTLGDSSSLESLCIEELDAKCISEEGLLPLSLTSLMIHNGPNLENLDYKGLYQLSFLKRLSLLNCPNLQRLPVEGLPKSILYLQRNC